MKSVILSAAALASSAHALVARGDTCCFGLTANGGPGGPVGQLSDGQNRIGQSGLSPAQFCLTDGALSDSQGRGCIFTAPTTQLQCDTGAAPTGGFAVGCDGTLSHDNGNTHFSSCPTGDNGGYNIYSTPPAGQQGCVDIILTADSCKSGCPSSPPPTQKTCPADLSGSYQYPHLIVPIDSSQPDKAGGTSYNGVVSSTVSSIFNFDIPQSYSGQTCSLVFLFPDQSQLETSSYTFSGSGEIDFSQDKDVATEQTSFNSAGPVATDFGVTTVAPGNSYSIATFDCPAGQAVSYRLDAKSGTDLTYFQDYNPSPIGLYITSC